MGGGQCAEAVSIHSEVLQENSSGCFFPSRPPTLSKTSESLLPQLQWACPLTLCKPDPKSGAGQEERGLLHSALCTSDAQFLVECTYSHAPCSLHLPELQYISHHLNNFQTAAMCQRE